MRFVANCFYLFGKISIGPEKWAKYFCGGEKKPFYREIIRHYFSIRGKVVSMASTPRVKWSDQVSQR